MGPKLRDNPRDRKSAVSYLKGLKMSIYAIIGMLGIGLGILVAFNCERIHLKLPVVVILATTPVIAGTMLIVSACFLSPPSAKAPAKRS